MKAAVNGGLIIGTHDGATVEIAEAIGSENVIFFGATADQTPSIRQKGSNTYHTVHEKLQKVGASSSNDRIDLSMD